MKHRHYVLRNKRSGHISSRSNQGHLAMLLKASQLITMGEGGIPTLLGDKVMEHQNDLSRVVNTHSLDLVDPRNRETEDRALTEVFKALVKHFLSDKKEMPARAKSAIKFADWLQSEMRKPRKEDQLLSAVHRLVGIDSPLIHMGTRQIQSTFGQLRKMQS